MSVQYFINEINKKEKETNNDQNDIDKKLNRKSRTIYVQSKSKNIIKLKFLI